MGPDVSTQRLPTRELLVAILAHELPLVHDPNYLIQNIYPQKTKQDQKTNSQSISCYLESARTTCSVEGMYGGVERRGEER